MKTSMSIVIPFFQGLFIQETFRFNVIRIQFSSFQTQAGREHRISKTALVLVGDFLAHSYRRSLLYHPGFSTEYRQGDGSAEADRP